MDMIATFDQAKNKLVMTGEIKGNLYTKKVIRSKHFLRIYGGYAIQKEILSELKHYGITDILIKEDTGNEYAISLENFLKRGFDIDLGSGKQVVVNERFFSKKEKDQLYL